MSEVKEKPKRIHYVFRTLHYLQKNFWSLLWFEILYKLFSIVFFFPIINKIIDLMLWCNRVPYLSNYNFLNVVANPITWVFMIAILLLMGMFAAIELCGIAVGVHASACGMKTSAKQMLLQGLTESKRVLSRHNFMFLVYVFLVMPLTSMLTGATIAQNIAIPGFIMETIHDLWYLRFGYYALLVFLVYLSIRWIYVIPSMFISRNNFKEATKDSNNLTKHQIFSVLLTILGWTLLGGVALVLLTIVFMLIGAFGMQWLDPTITATSLLTDQSLSICSIIAGMVISLLTPSITIARMEIGYAKSCEEEHVAMPEYKPISVVHLGKKWVKGLVACALIVGGYVFIPQWYASMKFAVVGSEDDTMVMAHRGDSVHAPENTLPAFQAAIDNGADAAELDVQMTKDGVIVVLHDSSITRTTGVNANIWDVTYDEIKDLDNGSFFDKSFSDTRIPTLEQVIQLCQGKLYLNIEIKRTGHDDGIEAAVLKIIQDNQFQDQCDITSMDYKTIETVRSIDPTIYTVYTTTVAGGSIADLDAADCFSVEGTFVDSEFIRYLKRHNKGVYIWTINDADTMDKLINWDVDAIITNNPVLCEERIAESKSFIGRLTRIQSAIVGQ